MGLNMMATLGRIRLRANRHGFYSFLFILSWGACLAHSSLLYNEVLAPGWSCAASSCAFIDTDTFNDA
jgi:hypothetical protein